MACPKTRGKIKVTCRSQGKGLTVTSACDLGEACYLGLYLLHAVIAQGVALPQQADTCTKFHHFLTAQSTIVKLKYFTHRQAIKSRVGKQLTKRIRCGRL